MEKLVSVPELSRSELEFYLGNGYRIMRHWHYMEREVEGTMQRPKLPDGYSWKGFTVNDKDSWLDCHNAAFQDYWEKRPISANEFSSYVGRPGFDSQGLPGIVSGGSYVAASSFASLQSSGTGSRGMIWTVGVVPEHRRRGLGKALTMKALETLGAMGVKSVGLYVDGENLTAFKMYKGLGFESVERKLILGK